MNAPAKPIGGAELQAVLIARALAERGLRVRHIVLPDEALVHESHGVEVIRISRRYERGGLARRLAILESLRTANAAVYVQRSAGFGTGVVGAFARATGRGFVFSSSSEADFKLDPATTAAAGASLNHWPTRLQYRLGLRLADGIVVQTEAQRELARAKLGCDAIVIPSFATFAPTAQMPRRPVFLWVGGVVEVKDPLSYVRLAQLAPETEFWMLPTDRGAAWNELAARLQTQAAAVPNLTLLPPRPRDELPELYASVTALVSTSKFEGFPNTFLEAWAQSTPTLSLTVDPDGVIRTHGLGVVADGSLEKLAAAVRRYLRDPVAAAAAGARAYAYVVRVHDSAAVADRWEAVIASVRRTRSAAAS